MIKKFKEYLEYRHNKKIAKRELAKMAAAILPVIRDTAEKSADIARLIVKLAEDANDNSNKRPEDTSEWRY